METSCGRSARWLAVRGDQSTPELFVNARGQTMTRAGFAFLLGQHALAAKNSCPSLRDKQISLRKVSLWLGHAQMQTTEVYLRADPMDKIETIEGMTPLRLKRGRFTVPDKLIASLKTR